MGYLDSVLAEDEQVVLHGHQHWKRLVPPVLIVVVMTGWRRSGLGVVAPTTWDQTAKTS